MGVDKNARSERGINTLQTVRVKTLNSVGNKTFLQALISSNPNGGNHLEFIFNTPSHHRVHHGSNRQYWDKNYAGVLIIWDRMLGTFEPEVEEVRYGISEPLNSNNPVKVFFHGISRLIRKFKKMDGFKNKLLIFIKPPDWMPSNSSGNLTSK